MPKQFINQRRKFHRAAALMLEIFYAYREAAFDLDIKELAIDVNDDGKIHIDVDYRSKAPVFQPAEKSFASLELGEEKMALAYKPLLAYRTGAVWIVWMAELVGYVFKDIVDVEGTEVYTASYPGWGYNHRRYESVVEMDPGTQPLGFSHNALSMVLKVDKPAVKSYANTLLDYCCWAVGMPDIDPPKVEKLETQYLLDVSYAQYGLERNQSYSNVTSKDDWYAMLTKYNDGFKTKHKVGVEVLTATLPRYLDIFDRRPADVNGESDEDTISPSRFRKMHKLLSSKLLPMLKDWETIRGVTIEAVLNCEDDAEREAHQKNIVDVISGGIALQLEFIAGVEGNKVM